MKLDHSTTGVYEVTTMSATYIIDFDRKVFKRSPDVGRTFNDDGVELQLLEFSDIEVGKSMTLWTRLPHENDIVDARYTTEVVLIVKHTGEEQ